MAEENVDLFILNWTFRREDSMVAILCEYCGGTRYSSAENIRVAREKNMHPACSICAKKLIAKHGGCIGGTVRHGEVIERKTWKN